MCDDLPDIPDIVIGYCSGSALALAITTELRGCRLAEPGIAGLGGLGPAGHDTASERDVSLTRRFGDELAALRDPLVAVHGGDDEAATLVDLLLVRRRSWLRFLASSAEAAPATTTGTVSVIATDPQVDLSGVLADPRRARVYHCPAADGALLTHPQTGETVRQNLSAAP